MTNKSLTGQSGVTSNESPKEEKNKHFHRRVVLLKASGFIPLVDAEGRKADKEKCSATGIFKIKFIFVKEPPTTTVEEICIYKRTVKICLVTDTIYDL